MYFRDVAGLDELKTFLRRTAQTGEVAHAQLFSGAEGGGAFPLALAYARYLNCQSPSQEDACGRCPSCLKYDALAHPDLFFIFPVVKASASPTPSDDFVGQWREMLAEVPYFVPADWLEYLQAGNSQPVIYTKEADAIEQKLSFRNYEAAYRVVLIWQPELMHESAANKLLKLIEEPPRRTLFFLVSSMPDKVLGTIQSRVQQIRVPPLREAEVAAALSRNGITTDVERIAHLAEGNYRRAVDMCRGEWADREYLVLLGRMMDAILKGDPAVMRPVSDELAQLGRVSQIGFLTYCLRIFRELYISRVGIAELNYLSPEEEGLVRMLGGGITGQNVRPLMEEVELAIRHIRQNGNGRMIFFDLLLRLTAGMAPALRAKGLK
ncbi:DNA polymerase III subunit delta' [Porphyromonas loveana]|uniref:DNA polymerase III subunit delta' n=1 Tax=Porphyromonas loveana TaxID=1884669 RepID=UPI00359FCA65